MGKRSRQLSRLFGRARAPKAAEEPKAEQRAPVAPVATPAKPIGWLRRLLIGEPLGNEAAGHQHLIKLVALAVFSSDALSSVAYATQEILVVYRDHGVVGPLAALAALPVAFAIILLLVVLTISYRQTIFAYPTGGGAYTVARDNLGVHAGLTAGAALLIDYILTVSVSVSAGVAAIDSAVPALIPHRRLICVFVVAIIMFANLRGVKESGRVFAIPTYAFVITILALILFGLYRHLTGEAPAPSIPPPRGCPKAVFLDSFGARFCVRMRGPYRSRGHFERGASL